MKQTVKKLLFMLGIMCLTIFGKETSTTVLADNLDEIENYTAYEAELISKAKDMAYQIVKLRKEEIPDKKQIDEFLVQINSNNSGLCIFERLLPLQINA